MYSTNHRLAFSGIFLSTLMPPGTWELPTLEEEEEEEEEEAEEWLLLAPPPP
jgi:hypothetical protein